MTWFKNHPNWTAILMMFVTTNLIFLPLSIAMGNTDQFFNVAVPLYGLVLLLINGWLLKQKGRSLFNLFYLLLSWIGFVIVLCLENKKARTIEQGKD